jgi:hypothetical protein
MMEGRSKTLKGKDHCQAKLLLFELSLVNTGLRALHFHGKAE